MKERITWIDRARGIGILLVIFEHCCCALLNFAEDPRARFICTFHMPLFFFISGFCHNNSNRSFIKYFLGRAYTLLLPSFFLGCGWNVIYFIQGIKDPKEYFRCYFQWFFIILFISAWIFRLNSAYFPKNRSTCFR